MPLRTARPQGYRLGDHLRICDRTGRTLLASDTVKEWNGLIVDRRDYEPRHPQEFIRGLPDDQLAREPRPWSDPVSQVSKSLSDITAYSGSVTDGVYTSGTPTNERPHILWEVDLGDTYHITSVTLSDLAFASLPPGDVSLYIQTREYTEQTLWTTAPAPLGFPGDTVGAVARDMVANIGYEGRHVRLVLIGGKGLSVPALSHGAIAMKVTAVKALPDFVGDGYWDNNTSGGVVSQQPWDGSILWGSGHLGNVRPGWTVHGSTFTISASEAKVWTKAEGVSDRLLDFTGATYTAGGNTLTLTDGLVIEQAGTPRRVWDPTNGVWGYSTEKYNPALGLDLDFDYVIDPVNGDDGNDGSEGSPFATLTALNSALVGTGASETVNALIKTGTYTDQYVSMVATFDGTANIVFEPGCVVQWVTGDAPTHGLGASASLTATATFYGNGVRVVDFYAADSSSPNGISCDAGTVIAYDVNVEGCEDGASAHGTGHMELYRCTIQGATKQCIAHVDTSTSYQEDCLFTSNVDGQNEVILTSSSGSHEFVNCTVVIPNTANNIIDTEANTWFRKCRLGDEDERIETRGIRVEDSYIHGYIQTHYSNAFSRCYGKLFIRLRDGGTGSPATTVDKCVFADGSLFIFADYTPTEMYPVTVTDSVITGYTIGVRFQNATQAGFWVSAGSSISNCVFYDNDTDFQELATITGTLSDIVYTDPGLSANTGYVMDDWKIESGTYGFSAIEETGYVARADDAWAYPHLDAFGLKDGDTVRLIATDGDVTDVTVSSGTLTIPVGHWATISGPAT